ncbi:hypothetical protein BT93_L3975 [Corymbia citriodora subsp. variegata]|uniref:Uncharacterized protein n=1 Tax=Corymbia citriodora subsp. variegata TaxID=360336 RepID=A0A8T0CIL1_CORYI|nr:hypothetical protein BT93_L3975 [Corymbia citriodora subsp. variegata]
MKSMGSISTCFTLPPSSRFHSSSSLSLRPPPACFPRRAAQQAPSFPGVSLGARGFRVSPAPAVRAAADLTTGVRPGGAVESDRLPSDVRKRAMDAVDSCGRRVTIGDVASRAGLKVNEAQRALQALAADTDGFLEVGSSYTVNA